MSMDAARPGELFLLDPAIIYLNHGSHGATPGPVFDAYQAWQRRLEREPYRFMHNELPGLLHEARDVLGRFVHADPGDIVYVPNATFGVNVAARAVPLKPGDEVLSTDHEYGAMNNVWRYLCGQSGAAYVRRPLDFPAPGPEALAEHLWGGVTPRTRVIFMSHITSPTALRLPVETVCARAREAGIMTVIDGAHAPGHVPLDLAALDPDFYVGVCHKWLCGPKGSAFLYARRDAQPAIEPLVVGWGWGEEKPRTFGSDFLDALQYLGTDDLSAYLAVPDAIRFQQAHDWPRVRARCSEMLRVALERIAALTGVPSPYGDGIGLQMAVVPLPPVEDLGVLKARLYDEFHIEVPCLEWNGRQFVRISVQAYNTRRDLEALHDALAALL